MTTEYGPGTIWMIFIAAGIGTHLLRISFIFLMGRVSQVPPRVIGVLRFVPSAVLTAIAVPAIIVLSAEPSISLQMDGARSIAGVIAALVAWRTESVIATICVGMTALWGAQFIL